MKILCVGDVVGRPGRDALEKHLPGLKKEFNLDFIVVNAENAAGGFGVTQRVADQLFKIGCDVLVLGDHVWDKREFVDYLMANNRVIRPANFPKEVPGFGWSVVSANSGQKIGIISLLGRVFMRYNVDCPFRALENILEEVKKQAQIVIVDFHAEATSEKNAFGFFADGKVSAVVGTHTHIQTADEKVLPKGTAYITDLGMTGPYDSVIGQKKEIIIKRFLTSMPSKFAVAEDGICLCGAVVEVDDATGLAHKITRIQRRIEQ